MTLMTSRAKGIRHNYKRVYEKDMQFNVLYITVMTHTALMNLKMKKDRLTPMYSIYAHATAKPYYLYLCWNRCRSKTDLNLFIRNCLSNAPLMTYDFVDKVKTCDLRSS